MNYDDRPWLAHYDEGVPESIDVPEITLVDLLTQSVERFGSSTCIIHNGKEWTYDELDRESNQFAHVLLAQGLQKGERVGLFLPNTAEFVVGYYGILKAGGVVMALNPAYTPSEVQKLAEESGIRFLMLPAQSYPKLEPLRQATPIERFIVVDDASVNLVTGDISWAKVLESENPEAVTGVQIGPDDPAVFQYSGGTTGTPKCAVGLHRNLVANVHQFRQWLVNTHEGQETVLVAIPCYHVYGMVLGMHLTIRLGARMVLIANPRDMDGLLGAIETYKATVFPGVPNLYAAINHYPAVLAGKYDLSSVKACISGSATLPMKVKREFEALTHGHLVEGYGLSEAPTATHCNPILGENREGSIGLPLPGVTCRIVDLETGTKDLQIGEAGELIIRGPQVMLGYHQKPTETSQTLREGWLFTGDVARMDYSGYFYLVDRKKDVIKVGGFQVWPNEIETVIRQHPKVREVAVAGVKDEDGAEVAKAWIVLNEGQKASAEEIKVFCRAVLTQYKIPKYIEFREALPTTGVGKVLRRVLVAEE
ncbi:long-chain fatty acid--CoA ligase [Chloroflexota bacterium]|nr:long-chain fatty acid--CoA ligase [Chloroflexota bacterium]